MVISVIRSWELPLGSRASVSGPFCELEHCRTFVTIPPFFRRSPLARRPTSDRPNPYFFPSAHYWPGDSQAKLRYPPFLPTITLTIGPRTYKNVSISRRIFIEMVLHLISNVHVYVKSGTLHFHTSPLLFFPSSISIKFKLPSLLSISNRLGGENEDQMASGHSRD
jgi:hypothetical protein